MEGGIAVIVARSRTYHVAARLTLEQLRPCLGPLALRPTLSGGMPFSPGERLSIDREALGARLAGV